MEGLGEGTAPIQKRNLNQMTLSTHTGLQKTKLNETHQKLGAKLVDFHGWEMPLQYSKVLDEHWAVRKAAGLFDVSHMGLLVVTHPEIQKITEALNSLIPQNILNLPLGKAVYTQLLNPNAGMLDDIIVYRLPESIEHTFGGQWLIICNASNRDKVQQWLKQHLPVETELRFINDTYGLIALQGPQFKTVLKNLNVDVDSLPKRFHIQASQINNTPVFFSRTGYTGEDGVEIIVPLSQIDTIWMQLLEADKTLGILPCGLAARDTLRLEAAYPLYGNDLSEEYTPFEAGLGWSVKLEQPADFIGKNALLKQKQQGLHQRFICFKLLENRIPREGFEILANDQVIGTVTSGGFSPVLDCPIGMGYIKGSPETLTNFSVGTIVQVSIRNKCCDAEIVERPFYKI